LLETINLVLCERLKCFLYSQISAKNFLNSMLSFEIEHLSYSQKANSYIISAAACLILEKYHRPTRFT
jgi:hypothetical protein